MTSGTDVTTATYFTIDTTDPRDIKALRLAATADQWKQNQYGQYLVPAQSVEGCYLTRTYSCTCEDNARGNVCKHRRAVAIFEALKAVNDPPKPSKWAAMSEAELFARL